MQAGQKGESQQGIGIGVPKLNPHTDTHSVLEHFSGAGAGGDRYPSPSHITVISRGAGTPHAR